MTYLENKVLRLDVAMRMIGYIDILLRLLLGRLVDVALMRLNIKELTSTLSRNCSVYLAL